MRMRTAYPRIRIPTDSNLSEHLVLAFTSTGSSLASMAAVQTVRSWQGSGAIGEKRGRHLEFYRVLPGSTGHKVRSGFWGSSGFQDCPDATVIHDVKGSDGARLPQRAKSPLLPLALANLSCSDPDRKRASEQPCIVAQHQQTGSRPSQRASLEFPTSRIAAGR
jgi:hypothetical protein